MTEKFSNFVYSEDMLQQAAAVETWVRADLRRTRRANIAWRVTAFGSTALAVVLANALAWAVPGIRLEPVFFYQKPDGVVETSITTDTMPADLADASIQAWLWQYVQHREGYSFIEAQSNHYVVDAMSSDTVREAYDRWVDGKNPQSYLAVYGRKGVIRVAMREITSWQPAPAGQLGRVTFHYDRQVEREGEPRQPVQTWSVTLEFVQAFDHGFRLNDIRQFNPSRIVVTAYPGPQLLPAQANSLASN